MGFFKNVSVSDIPDDPNYIPDGLYRMKVLTAETKATNSGDKKGLNIQWQIVEGNYQAAFPVWEWVWIPEIEEGREELTFEENRAFSRLVQHFNAMGFGADELDDLKDDDLIGREANVRLKNKPDKETGRDRASVVGVFPIEEEHLDISEEGLGIFGRGNSEDDTPPI